MSARDDVWLQEQAAILVDRMMANAQLIGDDPENVWIMLALAAQGAERSLLYAVSVMPEAMKAETAREYAAAKERLKRLLKVADADHDATAKKTDVALGVKRGAPQ